MKVTRSELEAIRQNLLKAQVPEEFHRMDEEVEIMELKPCPWCHCDRVITGNQPS